MKTALKFSKRFTASRKGFTFVELLVVMITLSILGGVLITLVHSGGSGYNHVIKNYEAENEARIALSYITVKVRQNDFEKSGAYSVVKDGSVLRIDAYDGSKYFDIWFDESTGELKEAINDGESNPENIIAAGLTSFNFDLNESGDTLMVTIGYNADGIGRELSGKVFLRSETAAP